MNQSTDPGELARLAQRVVELKIEHRDLDAAIDRLQSAPDADELTIKRLKKQKLLLKDRITSLEDQITPDIIA